MRPPDQQLDVGEDSDAIQRTLAGDQDAFAELVERYERRILGLLWHASGSREVAEDIAQEAFTRAYNKLETYSGEAPFYSWLARVAMNLLASSKRRKRIEDHYPREGFEAASESVSKGVRPDDVAELNETQKLVRVAISELNYDRRRVLLLRDFDGLDYDAIAAVLDVPVGTVRSRLHRARSDLKEMLKKKSTELGLGGAS